MANRKYSKLPVSNSGGLFSWLTSASNSVTSVFDGISSSGNVVRMEDFPVDFSHLERPPDRVVAPLVESERFAPKKKCLTSSNVAMTVSDEHASSSSSSGGADEGYDEMQDFSPDQVVSNFMTRKDPNTGCRTQDKSKFIPLQSCHQLSGHRVLLSESRLEALWTHLPAVYRYSSIWKLIYCPCVHGVSLRTFYRQCDAHQGPSLIFCEDAKGNVFGCYAAETWKCCRENVFYGDPSCFVFSFAPGSEKECFVYNWGGRNRYFQFSDSECFSIGGGDAFALWVGGDFLHGSSGPCSTFLNAVLSGSEQFVLSSFECWAFDHPMGSRLHEDKIKTIINDLQILAANAYSGEAYDILETPKYEEPSSHCPQMDEQLRSLAAGLGGIYGG